MTCKQNRKLNIIKINRIKNKLKNHSIFNLKNKQLLIIMILTIMISTWIQIFQNLPMIEIVKYLKIYKVNNNNSNLNYNKK